MNHRTLVWLLACVVVSSTAGCNIYGTTPCDQSQVVDDSSRATAVYDGSTGSGSVTGLSVSAQTADTVLISGTLPSGDVFTLTIPNVQSVGSRELDSESQVCDSATQESCSTLAGTITTTSFETQCGPGACALTIVGTLKGTASWMGSTFSIDVAMNHAETLQQNTCSEGS